MTPSNRTLFIVGVVLFVPSFTLLMIPFILSLTWTDAAFVVLTLLIVGFSSWWLGTRGVGKERTE